MSNKLYNEEQVRTIIGKAQMLNLDDEFLFSEDYLISSEPPLELPSDEEIDKLSLYKPTENVPYNPIMNIVWIEGAKWMRDKIQVGKDEQ